MSSPFKYVREYYKLPFIKRGMRISMHDKTGTITHADYELRVRFEGQKHSSRCHPTWEMIYYAEDGSVLADFTKNKEATDD